MNLGKFYYRVFLLGILLIMHAISSFSQTDTEFWFVAPEITYGHPAAGGGGEPIYFRVSALDLDAEVRIYQPANPAGLDTTFTVPAKTTVSIDVTPWVDDLENKPADLELNKGVHIVSDNLITVYYDEDEYYNQDIFALKGRNALGTEFYTPFNSVWPNGNYNPLPYSAIEIVATEDNTQITITPTADIVGHAAGAPFTITLNKGETFSCTASSQAAAGHLGGSHVVSDKPIALTLKDDSVHALPQGCKDLIGDQAVPIINADGKRIVGYEYIVMRGKINLLNPFAVPPDPDGVPTGERIFIMATQPTTQVFIDGVYLTTLASAGEQTIYELSANSTHVRGDKPIMVLHVAGFGCEFGGAVLPTVDGCTGSVEVSFTRSTNRSFFLNIMTIDAAKNAFVMHYEDGSTYPIPGTWFEPVGTTDYVCLRNINKAFANSRGGGVPQGEVVKITNSVSVFHLGLIEGGPTSGCKYGYFSDYSEAAGEVLIVESGSKIKFGCFGDTLQLRASGGISYSWSPAAYLDDPFIATPIVTAPPGNYNYDVTMNRGCFGDTTISVTIGIAEEIESYFDMDKWYICAPDTVTFTNESFGVDLSSVFYTQWDFDLDDPGNPLVYDTTSVFQEVFTNTTDTIETRTIQLLVRNKSCISEMRRDLIIRPEITAGFTNDVSDGCQPVTVNFLNTTTGITDRYKWTLGDGASANTANVTHTYLNTGMADSIYHVKMVAISPFYCADSVETDISVYPYLEADFALDTFQGCSPLMISIDNNSAGYIEEHEWIFGDGQTSSTSAATFTHTYTNTTGLPIEFNLRLVVKNNAHGCTDTLSRMIRVFPEVSSAFTPALTSACNGTEIAFTNQSSATASTFQWDFGEGGSSSTRNPVHTFENMTLVNADYLVRLVSTTPDMCRDTSYQTIRIHPFIHAEYSVDDIQGCAPFQVLAQNASEGAISDWEWDWGDGSPPGTTGDSVQTHLYQNSGPATLINTMQLVVQNADGCSDTMSRDITVFPEVQSQFTQDVTAGCNELQVNFTNQSSASAISFLWEFGDGASSDQLDPGHLFRNTGPADSVYTTRLIVASDESCRDTSEVDITVYSFVKANFTFSQATLCSPYDLTLNNSSVGGVSYYWDFGDGTDTTVLNTGPVTHHYINPSPTNPVTYQIVLTATNAQGCISVYSEEIEVMPAVLAGFTADITEGCHPVSVDFTNTSTGALSYSWDFDNGNSSDQSDPSVTFENFGSNDTVFQVKLVATNVYTCQDSFSVPILVHPYVNADFAIEYQRQCTPADVIFHNSSVNGQQYSWSFDGVPLVTGSTAPIARQFTNPSTQNTASFPVSLTVTSAQGCTSNISKQVSVFHEVDADFSSLTVGCSPLVVNFNNTSLGAMNYDWDFGDNGSSILEDPMHTFSNEGYADTLYQVKLTAISENFCTDSAFEQINVYPQPRAKFDLDLTGGCSPLNVNIENLSEAGDNFTWDFDDGSPPLNVSDLQPVSHTFVNDQASLGFYNIRLDVTNSWGCTDFISQTVTAYPSVDVDFERDSAGCSPFNSQFTNTSQRSTTYEWDFGDGGYSYVSEPGHTFVNTGGNDTVFYVKLIGASAYGCTDSMTKEVLVYPSPEARFSYTPIYQYFPSTTVDLVNETSAGTYNYEWDFEDGTTSTLRDPGSHTYSTWGEYFIHLRAYSDQCADSVVHWIYIFPPQPVADFVPDVDSGCVPLTVSLTNLSMYGYEYLWEFDDGTTSSSFEPTHTFTEPGYFNVKLTVIGEGGVDYAFREFDIYVLPEPDFYVKPDLVMLPDEEVKTFNLSKYGVTYLWDFGDGTTVYAQDTTHLYTAPGIYDVALTATTEHGCEAYLLIPEAVTVIAEGYILFPNVFRPNMSGPINGAYNPSEHLNQVFYPVSEGVVEYELNIYNRWGERLFHTRDLSRGWDGYHNGTLCEQGVYVWQVRVVYTNLKTENLAGDVTLLHMKN